MHPKTVVVVILNSYLIQWIQNDVSSVRKQSRSFVVSKNIPKQNSYLVQTHGCVHLFFGRHNDVCNVQGRNTVGNILFCITGIRRLGFGGESTAFCSWLGFFNDNGVRHCHGFFVVILVFVENYTSRHGVGDVCLPVDPKFENPTKSGRNTVDDRLSCTNTRTEKSTLGKTPICCSKKFSLLSSN